MDGEARHEHGDGRGGYTDTTSHLPTNVILAPVKAAD